jgi:opacity protein-like surface antigen
MRLALAYLTLAAALAFSACATYAADPPRKGKIAAPQQPQPTYVAPPSYSVPEPAYKVHNWYVGGVGAAVWGDRDGFEDAPFQAGIVAGYLWRSAVLGLGVEADYVIRDLGDARLDDGVASLRGRAGVFLGAGTFVYATAGLAEATGDVVPDGLRKGLVVGGGLEKDVTANVAVRAEVLHYRHAEDYFEWGDDGSTVGRVGLLLKF